MTERASSLLETNEDARYHYEYSPARLGGRRAVFSKFFFSSLRVDGSSSELICEINFKPKSLSYRLHRSTPDMVWLNPKSRFKLIPELIAPKLQDDLNPLLAHIQIDG